MHNYENEALKLIELIEESRKYVLDGVKLAGEIIDSGKALETLELLIKVSNQ